MRSFKRYLRTILTIAFCYVLFMGYRHIQFQKHEQERPNFETAIEPYEFYGELDYLGRTQAAQAVISYEQMPTVERESIQDVKPSGWHTIRYDDLIEDKYLYNRCHLIGYQLTGENANPNNLITCTRACNLSMLPYENEVAEYIRTTKHHVQYRVTPIYEDQNLVASSIVIEAKSIEDNVIDFTVTIPNTQPGIVIDYRTGESRREKE